MCIKQYQFHLIGTECALLCCDKCDDDDDASGPELELTMVLVSCMDGFDLI